MNFWKILIWGKFILFNTHLNLIHKLNPLGLKNTKNLSYKSHSNCPTHSDLNLSFWNCVCCGWSLIGFLNSHNFVLPVLVNERVVCYFNLLSNRAKYEFQFFKINTRLLILKIHFTIQLINFLFQIFNILLEHVLNTLFFNAKSSKSSNFKSTFFKNFVLKINKNFLS